VSEVGEEAVAGGLFLEAAGGSCSSVVFEVEGESSVAWYSEEVFEDLGFEHCDGVEGLSSWAFSVV